MPDKTFQGSLAWLRFFDLSCIKVNKSLAKSIPIHLSHFRKKKKKVRMHRSAILEKKMIFISDWEDKRFISINQSSLPRGNQIGLSLLTQGDIDSNINVFVQ